MSKQILLPDAQATLNLGRQLGRSLPPGSVLLLKGDLGSGKTTLVQGIGNALGITDSILSPTFTLINEYQEGQIPLYHLDLYRLEPHEVDQLQLTIYWDSLEVTPGIVAIEWPERLPELPDCYLEVTLTPIEPEGRLAIIQLVGNDPKDLKQTYLTIEEYECQNL